MMTDHPVKRRKKLIEVAIPLEAINEACAAEKQPGIGSHPRGLHLWWARRPLAAARAVIFCQLVDDPSAVPEEFATDKEQENERLRLFALISELVEWKNTNNQEVLNRANKEIRRSWKRCCTDNAGHPKASTLFNPEQLPGFHDPFSGGGALPLEAQRLGLDSYATDLNPVAVLINRGMIEIPPKFTDMKPINPKTNRSSQLIPNKWNGSEGLAEDVRYYGGWMLEQAKMRIGNLYPKIEITSEIVNDQENPRPDLKPYQGKKLNVIAWLWARTVKSPNPSFPQAKVPLASTFILSSKKGKEAYVKPFIERDTYKFSVNIGQPTDKKAAKEGTKFSRGNFRCLLSGDPIDPDHIRTEAKKGSLDTRLIAIIAEGTRGRVYLSPTLEHEIAAKEAKPNWKPDIEFFQQALGFRIGNYGMTTWGDLFTNRQLVALETFAGLIPDVISEIKKQATKVGLPADHISLQNGGQGSLAYAEAVATYLAFAIDRLADYNSSITTWKPSGQQVMQTYKRQALPMTWDFPESNILGDSAICWSKAVKYSADNLISTGGVKGGQGHASQHDAATQNVSHDKIVSTDPPYYDNIGYADLSDFFYVWLRRSLKPIYPDLFRTIAVPKAEELVATPSRHGGKAEAELFFLKGMTKAMNQIAINSHPSYPTTIYYAFKQTEQRGESGSSSTGWETFLEAVMQSGLAITGTWPISTELANRMRGMESNALATSMVLACHKREVEAKVLSRKEFRRKLRNSIPTSIKELERTNIAPVDIAQAAIGPGMAIFSQAKSVLNVDDSPMSVRDALIEINIALDEHLSADEGSFDADTRFALTFFESYGFEERSYGDAEGLAVARNISVEGVSKAGILIAIAGKVQLLRREQLDNDWNPSTDDRLCVWEATQHLISRLDAGGEASAAALLGQLKNLPGQGELAANCRALAYRLYNHCEKTKQTEEARAYNGLVIAWPELERLAASQVSESAVQTSLI